MIALLKGIVAELGDDHAIIDVNGVGYLVYCAGSTLGRLPGVGEAVTLHIETHVREDHIHLFGFFAPADRDWFKLLQSVQGVGARVALGILSTLTTHDLASAIAAQDKAMVGRAQGVGPKLAQRIVTELKDKVPATLHIASPSADGAPAPQSGVRAEALSALINLGYRDTDAARAVAVAAEALGSDAPLDGVIRAALRELAP